MAGQTCLYQARLNSTLILRSISLFITLFSRLVLQKPSTFRGSFQTSLGTFLLQGLPTLLLSSSLSSSLLLCSYSKLDLALACRDPLLDVWLLSPLLLSPKPSSISIMSCFSGSSSQICILKSSQFLVAYYRYFINSSTSYRQYTSTSPTSLGRYRQIIFSFQLRLNPLQQVTRSSTRLLQINTPLYTLLSSLF